MYTADGGWFWSEELLNVILIEGFGIRGWIVSSSSTGVEAPVNLGWGHVGDVVDLFIDRLQLIGNSSVGSLTFSNVFLKGINPIEDVVGTVIDLLLKDKVG